MTISSQKIINLQFRDFIHSKSGNEFQMFFGDIMEKAFEDFVKLHPGLPDGGNDGYIKSKGIYYQVYSPINAKSKDSAAIKKMNDDLSTLIKEWDSTEKIKEYNFVYNDKFLGSTEKIEKGLNDLNKKYPHIKSKLFLPRHLKTIFNKLTKNDYSELGFEVDQIESQKIFTDIFHKIQTELDREQVKSAFSLLEYLRDNIISKAEPEIILEYDLLCARCLNKLERRSEAVEIYKKNIVSFPNEIRSLLHYANILASENDFEANQIYLDKAKLIDENHPLLKLSILQRIISTKEITKDELDKSDISFSEPRDKAIYYKYLAAGYDSIFERTTALSYVEKGLRIYDDLLYLKFQKVIFSSTEISQHNNFQETTSTNLLNCEFTNLKKSISDIQEFGPRIQALINDIEMFILFHENNNDDQYIKLAKKNISLAKKCNFDNQIGQILINTIHFITIPLDELTILTDHLINSAKTIPFNLQKELFVHFAMINCLFNEGKKFFLEIKSDYFIELIYNIENKEADIILSKIIGDTYFTIGTINTLINDPELRKEIIEKIPDDNIEIKKDKLLLLLSYDTEDYEEAFNILRSIDYQDIDIYEFKFILEIAEQKHAWSYIYELVNQLLLSENNSNNRNFLLMEKFFALTNLEKFTEVIEVGKEILEFESQQKSIDQTIYEKLLAQTIMACFALSNVNRQYIDEAFKLHEKYCVFPISYEYSINVLVQLYIKKQEFSKAKETIINAIKQKKILSKEEYAKLNMSIFLFFGKELNISLDSQKEISENTFVKFKNYQDWIFLGTKNELDATKIENNNIFYNNLFSLSQGDEITFGSNKSKPDSVLTIELIYFIDQYIFWKSITNFTELANEGLLEGITTINISEKNGKPDIKNLVEYLESTHEHINEFYEIYKSGNYPLASLATIENGLPNAISHIQTENNCFINLSSGSTNEYTEQLQLSKQIISEKISFLIDGTSAFFLIESGLFNKIKENLNLIFPQSVLNMLVKIVEKLTYLPNQKGYLNYSQNKFLFSGINHHDNDKLKQKFNEAIVYINSHPESIKLLAETNRYNCFSEQKVLPELCDACILANRDKIPLLTDDYLYLQMNNFETNKPIPSFFSSFILIRALFEENILTFKDYLYYFSYLTSKRSKFLIISVDDIYKSIFGDKTISNYDLNAIKYFNFPLTLSSEYGVDSQIVLSIISKLINRIIIDDSIISDISDDIFVKIIEQLPREINKIDFSKLIINECFTSLKSISKSIISKPLRESQFKLTSLERITNTYNFDGTWIFSTST